MNKYVLILFLIVSFKGYAQLDTGYVEQDIHLKKDNFIFTYTKQIIESKSIQFVPGSKVFSAPVIQLDTSKVQLEYVKFFQVDNTFFANIDKVPGLNFAVRIQILNSRTDRFATRVHHGNANLYYFDVQPVYQRLKNANSNIYYRPKAKQTVRKYYYNIGTNDLVKLKYINANKSLKANYKSKEQLKRYVRCNIGGALCLGLTVPYTILWFAAIEAQDKPESRYATGALGAFGFLGVIAGSVSLFSKAKSSLRNAVVVY